MTVPPCYRIGVDVGGTNTDAVVINKSAKADDSPILASFKHPTTADVTEGIEKAIEAVLKMSGVDSASVKAVMIGTTVSKDCHYPWRGATECSADIRRTL